MVEIFAEITTLLIHRLCCEQFHVDKKVVLTPNVRGKTCIFDFGVNWPFNSPYNICIFGSRLLLTFLCATLSLENCDVMIADCVYKDLKH